VNINTENGRLDVRSQIAHSRYINCMDYAPSGALVATGDIDGALKIFDVEKQEMVNSFNNHGRGVKCVKFSPDGRSILTGSEDQHLHLCDVETQARTLSLVNHADWITSVAFNPMQPQYFVSTSLDKTVKLWQTGHPKAIRSMELADPVWSATFSPCGNYIVICTENGAISLISFVV
jgi:WD40 repeat protein